MTGSHADTLVHLELQTSDLLRARSFLAQLFGWRAETVRAGGLTYMTLDLGGQIGGGIVEQDTGRAAWIPYVEVLDVEEAAERGCLLGATMVLAPREGPAGWRSVLAAPAAGEIALWQPKR
jgi:predicted enzyme related to lactoylglutathione lyase